MYTDFVAIGQENSSWNVVRSEFDDLLLKHARSCGALVYEQTRVTSVNFAEKDTTRPISVSWTSTLSKQASLRATGAAATQGITYFKYLIDTSGREGIMSTKYLENRHWNQTLKNIAVWGYWRNGGSYGVGTTREGAPYFEALLDESGWAWYIPINDGTSSVGFVRNQDMYRKDKQSSEANLGTIFDSSATPNPSGSTTVARYISMFRLAPGIVKLITKKGTLVEGSVRSASDYSYSARKYAGTGFRIAGDAGAFIDPFFSSGVHLAMTSALSAAVSVCASIRGDCTEEQAAEWHTARFSTSYTRFQIVVLSAYKQLRSHKASILSDVSEDDYNRAFAFLRPIIQGGSEMGAQLYQRELQDSLDFCAKLFGATSPESHRGLTANPNIEPELLDLAGPVVSQNELEIALRGIPHMDDIENEDPRNSKVNSDEARLLLEKINARRVLNGEYSVNGFEAENLNGLMIRLERGSLGLQRV
ncbi:hypothetical protein D9757_012941 [Collybiopsis confluens]|uniref:Halogenase n=1 Tax=Collybiopsis confluens TaxID=2823264 RepID=A0A8H5D6Q5_9AGAR|nr:hypothetical protein D9757_012941 [Collybiopsis confluens]